MRRVMVVLAVLLGGTGVAACEPAPKVTITAKAQNSTKPPCGGYEWITGTVTPATATPKVWLQHTENGKWVDWRWHTASSGGMIRYLHGNVQSDGSYRIQHDVPEKEGATYHVRVRSDGGTVVSNGVYLTPTEYPLSPCG